MRSTSHTGAAFGSDTEAPEPRECARSVRRVGAVPDCAGEVKGRVESRRMHATAPAAVALRAGLPRTWQVGAVLAVATGLFWLGVFIFADFRWTGEGSGGDDGTMFVFMVAPSLACVLAGAATLSGLRGWRWVPVIPCGFFAVVMASIGGLENLLIVLFNTLTALLLTFPLRRARVAR